MKQIQILFCLLLLGSVSCIGQNDSTKSSNHSWSFTAGVNFSYPLVDQYRIVSESNFYACNFLVQPKASCSPWLASSYSRTFCAANKNSLSYVVGVGFTQYTFKSIATGWYWGDFSGDSGTFNWNNKINTFNIGFGIESKSKFRKYNSWYNQLYINMDYDFNLRSSLPVHMDDLSINYKTGIEFHVVKNIFVSPTISFPLLSLNSVQKKHTGTEYFGCIKSGITLLIHK